MVCSGNGEKAGKYGISPHFGSGAVARDGRTRRLRLQPVYRQLRALLRLLRLSLLRLSLLSISAALQLRAAIRTILCTATGEPAGWLSGRAVEQIRSDRFGSALQCGRRVGNLPN